MVQISDHLNTDVDLMLSCPCGCRFVEHNPDVFDKELIGKFEALRAMINQPIIVTSGYRCYDFQLSQRSHEIASKCELYGMSPEELRANRLIWHSVDSLHCKGLALDIKVRLIEPFKLFSYAIRIGFTGCGLYPTFCHVDVRDTFTVWNRK